MRLSLKRNERKRVGFLRIGRLAVKLKIIFGREASYREKDLQLLLMRFFNPTKLFWFPGGSFGSTCEAVLEGADAVNPFETLELLNVQMRAKDSHWEGSFTITIIEMESPKEKESIPTWVLAKKLT